MAIPILPQGRTVADAAPWLLAPNVTVHCYGCNQPFTPEPDDRPEADGSYECRACATESLRWHREMNPHIFGVAS